MHANDRIYGSWINLNHNFQYFIFKYIHKVSALFIYKLGENLDTAIMHIDKKMNEVKTSCREINQ